MRNFTTLRQTTLHKKVEEHDRERKLDRAPRNQKTENDV